MQGGSQSAATLGTLRGHPWWRRAMPSPHALRGHGWAGRMTSPSWHVAALWCCRAWAAPRGRGGSGCPAHSRPRRLRGVASPGPGLQGLRGCHLGQEGLGWPTPGSPPALGPGRRGGPGGQASWARPSLHPRGVWRAGASRSEALQGAWGLPGRSG